MKEEQDKKMSPIVGATDDKVPVPAKSTALSDEDLDKVAGGVLPVKPSPYISPLGHLGDTRPSTYAHE